MLIKNKAKMKNANRRFSRPPFSDFDFREGFGIITNTIF